MKKTNAARILDRLKIDYELKEYKVDLNDLSAIHVAKDVNMDIKTVFKTLELEVIKMISSWLVSLAMMNCI